MTYPARCGSDTLHGPHRFDDGGPFARWCVGNDGEPVTEQRAPEPEPYQLAARAERDHTNGPAFDGMPTWMAHRPPDYRHAMRQALAARPRYEDEREIMAEIMAAPITDPLGPVGRDWPTVVYHSLPDQTFSIVMPAPDDLPDGAEKPYGVGAGVYTSAPAGAWWAWLLRHAPSMRRAYWHVHPDGATDSERSRGLPPHGDPLARYGVGPDAVTYRVHADGHRSRVR